MNITIALLPKGYKHPSGISSKKKWGIYADQQLMALAESEERAEQVIDGTGFTLCSPWPSQTSSERLARVELLSVQLLSLSQQRAAEAAQGPL